MNNLMTVERIKQELMVFHQCCTLVSDEAKQQGSDISDEDMQQLHDDYERQRAEWDLLMSDVQPENGVIQ